MATNPARPAARPAAKPPAAKPAATDPAPTADETKNDDAAAAVADAGAPEPAPAAPPAASSGKLPETIEPRKPNVPQAERAASMTAGGVSSTEVTLAAYVKEREGEGEKTITMKIPNPFRLSLDDKRVVQFPKDGGAHEVPESIAGHFYVKANGAEPYKKKK